MYTANARFCTEDGHMDKSSLPLDRKIKRLIGENWKRESSEVMEKVAKIPSHTDSLPLRLVAVCLGLGLIGLGGVYPHFSAVAVSDKSIKSSLVNQRWIINRNTYF